jgi:N-acylneuraminate cytidylyltransferase/CMP-N,N'-diacetyllegionaminic acid synthase
MSAGVLAIIPARGGSKRVPRKNVRVLGDKPLIAWTIDAARRSGVCDTIAVSTDDPEIARAAADAGVSVPHLRPEHLARDETPSIDVIEHEIRAHRARGTSVSTVILLQPTSPFRRASTIREALSRFLLHDRRSVISVSPLTDHPTWCRAVDADETLRSQVEGTAIAVADWIPSVHVLNGLIYVADADALLARRSLYTDPSVALVVSDRVEAIDIDTPLDWSFAEAALSASLVDALS